MRIVGSMTTLPYRYSNLLRTLKSIEIDKLDALYLCVPKFAKRLQQPYPEIPEEIKQYCTIVECEDYGPATKIVGALMLEEDPDTVIITFDDDIVYSKGTIDELLEYHKRYPNSGLSASALLIAHDFPFYSYYCSSTPKLSHFISPVIPEEGRPFDVLCGFSAALYVRKFFPSKENLDQLLRFIENPDVFMNDDVLFSGYLSKQNIERRVIPTKYITDSEKVYDPNIDYQKDNHAISSNMPKFIKRFKGAVKYLQEQDGHFSKFEPQSYSETGVFIIGIPILCVIILIFIIFLLTRPQSSLFE